jgi:hypothetical protein
MTGATLVPLLVEMESHKLFCPHWSRTMILLISASQVARITYVIHPSWPSENTLTSAFFHRVLCVQNSTGCKGLSFVFCYYISSSKPFLENVPFSLTPRDWILLFLKYQWMWTEDFFSKECKSWIVQMLNFPELLTLLGKSTRVLGLSSQLLHVTDGPTMVFMRF